MDKKFVKIFDRNFAHAKFTTDFQDSKYIEWDRICNNIKDDELIFLTDDCMRSADSFNGRKIGMLMEPRAINEHIYNYVGNNNVILEAIFTYDKILLDSSDKFQFYPHCGCWIQPENQMIYPKTSLLSIVASSKQSTIGHRLRHAAINEIRQLNLDIDVYGNGYNPVIYKLDAMKNHAFTIVIENSKIDYYFTEKLIDSFMTGTVPIYWGCPSIGDFFNLDGMLIFDDLNTLLNHVNTLSLEKYQSMLLAIKENYEIAKNFLIAEDWLYENTNIFKK
jgi:hypothetical protein